MTGPSPVSPTEGDDELQRMREVASAAAQAAAFKTEDREIIHCRMTFTGADWDLSGVLELIHEADEITFAPSIFGHDLHVRADGRMYHFEVPMSQPADRKATPDA